MSRSLLTLLVSVLLVAVALPLLAQETADIALGGGLVARLREAGPYAGVRERAAAVDKNICTIVSNKDTQHPQVSVKPVGKVWTVYAWDVAVMGVYPAEAKANGVSEKALAEHWAASLKTQLPKATPCSKLPPEMLGYKPAGKSATVTTTVTAKPAAAKPPVKTVTTKADAAKPVAAKTVAAKPVATKVAVTKPVTTVARPTSTMLGNESGALLLIVDALRTSRSLNDQDWAVQKESIARGLYGDLGYYLTGKGVAPKLPVASAKVTVTKPVGKPLVTTVKPVAKPVVTATKGSKPVAAASKPVVKPVVAPKTPLVTVSTPVADATTAKVPQKNRIRAKFAASKPAFDKLQASDPTSAAQVSTMLAASRQAFAYGNFDESEKQVDAALSALGVTYSGQ